MLIPAVVSGDYATAAREVRKSVTRFRSGSGWNDALGRSGTLSTKDITGLILLNGPNPLLGKDQHIHAYLPLSQLTRAFASGRIRRTRGEEVFQESLTTAAGILGLLAPANQVWVYAPERHELFLNAVRSMWRELAGEGDRYSMGMATGSSLWSLPTNLKFVLARRAIDVPVLNSPLPPGGIDALITGLNLSTSKD